MKTLRHLRLAASSLLLLCAAMPQPANAHSGKARFHVIVDTDGAADDLRALCLLLGNRETEVLAITASEGALPPDQAAQKVTALLAALHHEGIPVGAGRSVGAPEPAWRALSQQVAWGDAPRKCSYSDAREVIAAALATEEEKTVFLALGALTNLADALQADPATRHAIKRVIWYGGANRATDTLAARQVLESGIPMEIIEVAPETAIAVTEPLLRIIAAIPTPCARLLAATHRTPPLAGQVASGHLKAWDDWVVVRLFYPELFEQQSDGKGATRCTPSASETQLHNALLALLRGKPDTESRVLYGFPHQPDLYAEDVAPIIGPAIERHGESEWRAAVLTNELHGHLGIYATLGVKMGIRAREYFDIGIDDIVVVSAAGQRPPVSCLNDGLQVSTGATVGHGLITAAPTDTPRPEAVFRFKGRAVRLALKTEYAARIRSDIHRCIQRHGNLTPAYWAAVRQLALDYWRDFDRHTIFDLYVEN